MRCIDTIFEIKFDETNVIIIENPKAMREFVQNLMDSFANDNEDWMFSEKDRIIKKNSCVDIIFSLFSST